LTMRLGDQHWLEVLRAHHALIRGRLHAHDGYEVKCQGDGFMLAFGSARRALECAIAIQRAIQDRNTAQPDDAVQVRIGLHTGEAIKDADDFHGKDVVLAARIANAARGGEILVSPLVRDLVGSVSGVEFRDAGRKQLKGLPGRQRVYEAVWHG
jgi:class 3 adenylate cyclase